MFCRLLLASFVYVGVRGGISSPIATGLLEECRQANQDVDKALAVAKFMMAYEINRIHDDGFHRELELSLLGIRLPFTISMNVSEGALNGYQTFVRTANTTVCSSSLVPPTLEGQFEYQQDLRLSYDTMSSELLYWVGEGSLTYVLQPKISVVVSKSEDGCKLDKFILDSPGKVAYEVVASENSWASWLLGKLVHFALYQHDSAQMLNIVMKDIRESARLFFVPAWCDVIN